MHDTWESVTSRALRLSREGESRCGEKPVVVGCYICYSVTKKNLRCGGSEERVMCLGVLVVITSWQRICTLKWPCFVFLCSSGSRGEGLEGVAADGGVVSRVGTPVTPGGPLCVGDLPSPASLQSAILRQGSLHVKLTMVDGKVSVTIIFDRISDVVCSVMMLICC